jgi:hypothetical protein
MSDPADWARCYARQADADLKAWEYYETHPEAATAECHKLLFLQMACEKLCKAHLIQSGTPPASLQTSHGYVATPLPAILLQLLLDLKQDRRRVRGVLVALRHLCSEIELLSPAVDRNGQRPDNCEYPWEDGRGVVHSPLDWSFHPTRLCIAPAGRIFLKALRQAIDGLLRDRP